MTEISTQKIKESIDDLNVHLTEAQRIIDQLIEDSKLSDAEWFHKYRTKPAWDKFVKYIKEKTQEVRNCRILKK